MRKTILCAALGMLAMFVTAENVFGQVRARAAVRAATRAALFGDNYWYPGMYTGWNSAYPFYGNRAFYGGNHGWYGGNYGWYGGNYGWPGYGHSSFYSPGYSYSYVPAWRGGYSYYYPSTTFYAPATTIAQTPLDQSSLISTEAQNQVHLRVHVPDPNAQIIIQDQAMQTSGMTRLFVSPPLEQDNYVYTIKATWMENGRQRTETQKIDVQPGRGFEVVFPRQAQQQRVPEPLPSSQIRGEVRNEQAVAIQGSFLRAENGQLVITTSAGQQQMLTLGQDVKVMLDGRPVQINDLRQGAQLTIQTSGTGDAATVTKIEASGKVNRQKQ